jgi:hypothetical protein
MVKLAILGSGNDKFDDVSERIARNHIIRLLKQYKGCTLVSGRSPIGGVDVWAEQIALDLGIPTDIKAPITNTWDGPYGFKTRNIDIARVSDVLYAIVVDQYPKGYEHKMFDVCYHCAGRPDKPPLHVKSGSCYTLWKAKEMGKEVHWIIISNGQESL